MSYRKYPFTLLDEAAVDCDIFPEKTHEKIADAIYDLVSSPNTPGITIGVEGDYGSGKSTVVNILRKKLENRGFLYLYFDAWAHEGDHLRRSFLEASIRQLSSQVSNTAASKLSIISDTACNKRRNTRTISVNSPTRDGTILSLSLLLVPFGAAIISSIDYTGLSFTTFGSPDPFFILGLLTSLAPIIAIIILAIFKILTKKVLYKEIFRPNHWSFISTTSTENRIYETSEEDERSSIEFEKYFHEIMELCINEQPSVRFVLVLDNLDRIDSDSALRIWSILQTFLQRRNPGGAGIKTSSNLWVIVPYDQTGMAGIWEQDRAISIPESSDPDNIPATSNTNNIALEHFLKCLQIRFEVPKPITSQWDAYIRSAVEIGIQKWDSIDKQDVIRIFSLYDKAAISPPTPRIIKTYINEVAILRNLASTDIATTSICYYVIIRFLRWATAEQIRKMVAIGRLPERSELSILDVNIRSHIAGLLFGVNPKIGYELLLRFEIADALLASNSTRIASLVQTNRDEFWVVFNNLIDSTSPTILQGWSATIITSLWEDYREACTKYVQASSRQEPELPHDDSSRKAFHAHLEMRASVLDAHLPTIKHIQALIAEKFKNNSIVAGDSSTYYGAISQLNVTGLPPVPVITSEASWTVWAASCYGEDFSIDGQIVPLDDNAKLLTTVFEFGAVSTDQLKALLYTISTNMFSYLEFISSVGDVIRSVNDPSTITPLTHKILDALFLISRHHPKSNESIAQLMRTSHFYNFVRLCETASSETYNISHAKTAILAYKLLDSDFFSLNFGSDSGANTGLSSLANIWRTADADNAKRMEILLVKYSLFSLVWRASELPDVKNCKHIVLASDDASCLELFSGMTTMTHFSNLINYTENLVNQGIYIQNCIINTQVIEVINNADISDIISHTSTILAFINKANPNIRFPGLIINMNGIEPHQWILDFDSNELLISLLEELERRGEQIKLGNNYTDALSNYISKTISSPEAPNAFSNLSFLSTFVDDPFVQILHNKVSDLLIESWDSLAPELILQLANHSNYNAIINTLAPKIHSLLYDALAAKDILALQRIDAVLSLDTGTIFAPSHDEWKTIRKPLNNLQEELRDSEIVDVINRIALRYNHE